MTYLVYTDGACDAERNVMSSAFIVITERVYIDHGFMRSEGRQPSHAETIAVGLAFESLMNEVDIKEDDTVNVYIDCASTLDYIKKLIDTDKSFHARVEVYKAIAQCRELNKKCQVNFFKHKAHKFEHNPNKYVDSLSKFALRSE